MTNSSDGLHGYEFKLYFQNLPIVNHFYKNVCSLDEIPKFLKPKQFVVVNLSKQSEPGSHWFVIVRSDKTIYEVFNSLGFHNLDAVRPYLKLRKSIDVVFNEHAYQLSNTSTCGYFCIYFIVHRILNNDMSFHHLLDHIFDENNEANENKVTQFCYRLKHLSKNDNLENFFD